MRLAWLALAVPLLALASCGQPAAPSPSTIATGGGTSPSASSGTAALTFRPVLSEPIGQDNVETLAFSPDASRLAVGAADGTVAIYYIAPTQPDEVTQARKVHAGFVSSIAWSPAGDKVLSAAGDGFARVWDARTFAPLASFGATPATYPAAVWSPDGKQIALAQGRDNVQVLDASGSGSPQTLNLPGSTRALLWLPSGDLVASDQAGNVAFFQPRSPAPVRTYQPSSPHKAVNALALDPAAPLLAVGYDDGTVVLLDSSTANVSHQFSLGNHQTGSLAWSPNGQVLAVTSTAFAVSFFDAQGQRLANLNIGYDMNGVAWSPDGRYLAAGSDDHTLKIWQVSPPQTPARLQATPPSYMGR